MTTGYLFDISFLTDGLTKRRSAQTDHGFKIVSGPDLELAREYSRYVCQTMISEPIFSDGNK